MIPFDPALGAKRYLLPAALLRSAHQARAVIRAQGAHAVVGMGGYPSAPAVLGARLAGLPAVIHESNAVPGRANQFAARLTPHVAVAFNRSRVHLAGGDRALTTGMPISAALAGLAELAGPERVALRAEARRALRVPAGRRLVVFNGGSLGAVRLTGAAVALARLWQGRDDVQLLVKTGPAGAGRRPRRPRGLRRAPDRTGRAVPGPDGPGVRGRRPGGVPGRVGDGGGAGGDRCPGGARPLPPRPRRPSDPQRPGAVRRGRRAAAARRGDHRRTPRRSHRPAAGRSGPAGLDGRMLPTPARTRGPPTCWPRKSSASPHVRLPTLEHA